VDGCQLRLTDGRPASQVAAQEGAQVAVFDLPVSRQAGAALAWAASSGASPAWQAQVPAWLSVLGFQALQVADTPALVVARTLAMLINEAADAVQQGVCSQQGADSAMKLGVNYPAGPFEWLADWNAAAVVGVLNALDGHYRGERYRASPWLQHQVWKAGQA
jgi:3-hydroxybutyryl-CoA dehydrogenase